MSSKPALRSGLYRLRTSKRTNPEYRYGTVIANVTVDVLPLRLPVYSYGSRCTVSITVTVTVVVTLVVIIAVAVTVAIIVTVTVVVTLVAIIAVTVTVAIIVSRSFSGHPPSPPPPPPCHP